MDEYELSGNYDNVRFIHDDGYSTTVEACGVCGDNDYDLIDAVDFASKVPMPTPQPDLETRTAGTEWVFVAA